MAGIKPPKPFDFQNAAYWPACMDEFDDYRFASGLHEKKDEVQVRTLLYTTGRKSREIFRSPNVNDEEMEDFKLVKSKFNDYFVHTKNIVYESVRFIQRCQQLGETVDQFATELSKLADRCEFAGMKERLIRDHFVVGLRDQVLSEELQMDPKLTMATALARARTSETVKQQQAELKEHEGTVPEACVAAVKPEKATAKSTFTRCQKPAYHQNNCSYCAGPFHPRNKCPAQKETCRFCQKLGQYEKACRKKKQKDTNLDSITEADGKFKGTVEQCANTQSEHFVTVKINDQTLRMKVGTQVWLKDRGAEGMVLRLSKTPRSYWVQTEGKTIRRNRRHLFLLPHRGETSPVRMEQHPRNSEPTDATDKDIVATKSSDIKEPRSSNKTSSPEQRTTRYGRVIRAPKRLGNDD
ncbi:hypothetical protein MRX96_054323 [Rhipicephalus microplus]